MAVYINPENNNLILELSTKVDKPEYVYQRLFLTLLDLLQSQDENFINRDTNYFTVEFLKEIFPDSDQLQNIFSGEGANNLKTKLSDLQPKEKPVKV
jgi:hypothetical protein